MNRFTMSSIIGCFFGLLLSGFTTLSCYCDGPPSLERPNEEGKIKITIYVEFPTAEATQPAEPGAEPPQSQDKDQSEAGEEQIPTQDKNQPEAGTEQTPTPDKDQPEPGMKPPQPPDKDQPEADPEQPPTPDKNQPEPGTEQTSTIDTTVVETTPEPYSYEPTKIPPDHGSLFDICIEPPDNCPPQPHPDECKINEIIWKCVISDNVTWYPASQCYLAGGGVKVERAQKGWGYNNGKPINFCSFSIQGSAYNNALDLSPTHRICTPCHPNKYIYYQRTTHPDSTYKYVTTQTNNFYGYCKNVPVKNYVTSTDHTYGYFLNGPLYIKNCDSKYSPP